MLSTPRRTALALAVTLAALCSRIGAAPAAAQAAPGATPTVAADSQAVLAVVNRLFDAMRAGDSAAVRAVFHPQVQLATAGMRQGAPVFGIDSLETFVRAVGTPHPDVWDERLYDTIVHIDGPLAVVWTGYDFYAGTRFSHCGVDAFQLARTAEGWKIVALTDTRRREGCRTQPAR
jgi:hypothetical protein